jgi:hypothetical protein
MVEFKCQRCNATILETLKDVLARSPDDYGYLHNLRTPEEWSDNFYGWLLCPECTQKLKEFMKAGSNNENS